MTLPANEILDLYERLYPSIHPSKAGLDKWYDLEDGDRVHEIPLHNTSAHVALTSRSRRAHPRARRKRPFH